MSKPEDRRLGHGGNGRHLQPRRQRKGCARATTIAGCTRWATGCGTPTLRSARTGAIYSLLSGRIVPSSGGNTEFADMRAAYDALDDETKAEVEDLVTEHSHRLFAGAAWLRRLRPRQRGQDPPGAAPAGAHAPGDRAQVAVSVVAYRQIVGWPVPEARAFIRDLTEHATQPHFVYAHQWRTNDLVMWDNRTTMHRARRYDDLEDVRDLRRTTIKGTG